MFKRVNGDSDRHGTATRMGAATAMTMALAALIASVWLFGHGIMDSAAAAQATGALPVRASAPEPPAFRPDAWYLPDDPMLGFVEIPAGPFQMGSDPARDPQSFENERWAEDGAPGSVDVATYLIGRFEVTV